MKPVKDPFPRKREMLQDAVIVLMPPILILAGILWFVTEDWVPFRLARVLVSFIQSLLARLTG